MLKRLIAPTVAGGILIGSLAMGGAAYAATPTTPTPTTPTTTHTAKAGTARRWVRLHRRCRGPEGRDGRDPDRHPGREDRGQGAGPHRPGRQPRLLTRCRRLTADGDG